MIFKEESIEECWKELDELSHEHYDDLAPYKDIPMKVDWARYIRLQKNDNLVAYIARDDSGKLQGYCGFFLSHPLDFSGSFQANLVNLFVSKESRGFGVKFILWCEEQLKEKNVQVVYQHVKVFNDHGGLLEKLGYEKMNIEYCKRLDKEI